MDVHKHSSFTHSCIHPPRRPKSQHSSPKFVQRSWRTGAETETAAACHDDEIDKLLLQSNQGESVGRELGSTGTYKLLEPSLLYNQQDRDRLRYRCAGGGFSEEEENTNDNDLFNLKSNILEDLEIENDRFRSMSDFYDSIPDYNDLHHLSEAEFYARLERLKIQQQELMDLVVGVNRPDAGNQAILINDRGEEEDDDDVDEGDKNIYECNSITSKGNRPTSSSLSKTKKSVRISSGTTYRTEFSEYADEDGLNVRPNSRSKSASPSHSRTRSLTVPRPFKMTQREEEEKMIEDLATSKRFMSKIAIDFDEIPPPETSRRPKVKPFKANPVPLTSRIPLYEHIKEDHRRKSTLAKLNSAIELQSQIKPFKFSGDKSMSRCLSRATSTPNLDRAPGGTSAAFKANPCPKNLFSNYFYNKMWEDDYFRTLNRKIRAEEMLKISNLPPSMAKRNESSLAEFDLLNGGGSRSGKAKRRKRKGKKSSKQHYEFKDSCSKKSINSSIASSSCGTTPIPSSYPVNRPNLAATLRVQSAKQKVRELAKPKSIVPKNKLTETASTPTMRSHGDGAGWGVRKSPAWRSMNYDPSNVEDIAIRLATRRAEQRLRQEEHEISMELMKQRVRAAPLLLEGPTYWGPRVGQLSHHCRSTELDRERKRSGRRSRNASSKLSFYSTEDICEEEK